MRIASRPLTWYWKWGASQLSVSAIGLTSFDQRQPGWKDQPADLGAADLQDLGAAVGELADLVGRAEGLVLGLPAWLLALLAAWDVLVAGERYLTY